MCAVERPRTAPRQRRRQELRAAFADSRRASTLNIAVERARGGVIGAHLRVQGRRALRNGAVVITARLLAGQVRSFDRSVGGPAGRRSAKPWKRRDLHPHGIESTRTSDRACPTDAVGALGGGGRCVTSNPSSVDRLRVRAPEWPVLF